MLHPIVQCQFGENKCYTNSEAASAKLCIFNDLVFYVISNAGGTFLKFLVNQVAIYSVQEFVGT